MSLGPLNCLKPILRPLYRSVKYHAEICKVRRCQRKALAKLKDKPKIRCVFFALFEEIWKVDGVYRLMEDHPRFDPVILVCPIVNYGHDNMIRRMNSCYEAFQRKGYHVIKSYDEANNTYIDVLNDINPDIIFYTNPYPGLIDDRYYIDQFCNVLTAYVPYFYNEEIRYNAIYDSLFHNIVWRHYIETDFHKGLSRSYSRCHGCNTVVTGYPGIEQFLNPVSFSDNCWKVKNQKLKRVIWAPHHTLEAVGTCHYSCFLRYCDFMLDMAKRYRDKVQFVFKPHPLLKNKLCELWGSEKTEAYYDQWAHMENTTIVEGEYVDLFLSSDAMIHDSGSFLIEYLYVNKPVMRTLNDIPLESMYNQFALNCLDQYYKARCEQDIEQFIQNVINGIDPLKAQRTKFIHEALMPNGSPSQNIIDDILDSIDNQILYRN